MDRGESLISRALLKYDYSNFKLEILEYCDPKDVIKREQHYLDNFKGEYNILPTAGSLLGHKHTEETKAKIRDAFQKIWHNRDQTARAAIIAAANAARSQAVLVTNLHTGETVEYASQNQAARELGFAVSTIHVYLKNGKPLKGI